MPLLWPGSSLLRKGLQVTKVGGDTSPPYKKILRVPKRSYLRPILFTLYNTGLSSCVKHGIIHTHADHFQWQFHYDFGPIDQVFAEVVSDLVGHEYIVSSYTLQMLKK